MTKINYVNDKFIPTPLPEICAPRRELLALYQKASANRLTVVCAPAGYGKTVSTLLWIGVSKRRSVWIGLDEYDNAPFVFYKLFCTGILSIQPDNTKMEEILNSKAFYSHPLRIPSASCRNLHWTKSLTHWSWMICIPSPTKKS